jgi:hydroxymethylpyrimidine pyrophosphatase-like HAD family hydrolase
MRYLALACDYDGTLATHGRVDEATLDALERVRASGRKVLLVTGREIDDLRTVFDRMDVFDCVVAENGALLHWPETGREQLLGETPPPAFIDTLRRRYVPISVGRVIVATWEPHERAVLETIRDLGLELHVIFNKGAVMVLPAGVSKASGLEAALAALGLSAHNVVGVGDAENDHAFLASCECSVAVANALDTIKDRADHVTRADHGAGVVEMIEDLLATDLASCAENLERHHFLLGCRADPGGGSGSEVFLPPYDTAILVAGSSGAGKSTLATGVLERIVERGYQCCVIDPEGDYGTFAGAALIGTPQRAPTDEEAVRLLEDPRTNAIVNLMAVRFADRPGAFTKLLGRLVDLRTRAGRPHWLIVDEAHHVAPSTIAPSTALPPAPAGGLMLITVEPHTVAPSLLAGVNVVVTVGAASSEALADFARTLGEPVPQLPGAPPPAGQALVWDRRTGEPPFFMQIVAGQTERERHTRKYAEGELAPDRSFYFRGPGSKLNLRAQNLLVFNQIAEGLDDGTWLHHLRRGDYSRWFRQEIKDDALAAEAERVERAGGISAHESRVAIREAIERRYTVPA